MTKFTSTVRILKINPLESKTSKSGHPYTKQSAECLLMDDTGELVCVGKLSLPESLRAQAAAGDFRAGFSLEVPTWGDQAGQIVARLVSLIPVPKTATKAA